LLGEGKCHDLALRWRDLDLERAELRVMQNVHDVRKDRVTRHMDELVPGFRFGPPKTHRSRRPVSMPVELVPPLLAWRSMQAKKQLAAGDAWVPLDLVFTKEAGLPHSEGRVRKHFYEVLSSCTGMATCSLG
jgi:hypothetical protein